jgi:prepilin peptidase CpaA
MNLIAQAPLWLLALLAAALAAAAIEDAIRLRISNATSLVVLIGGLIAMALDGFPLALWQNGVVFVVLLALGTLLFASGKVGGGDVKLLASLGLWMDIRAGFWLLIAVSLAGGILALGFIVARLVSGRRTKKKLAPGKDRGIPYGLAIVAGACIVFAGQLGWLVPTQQKPDPFSVRVPG